MKFRDRVICNLAWKMLDVLWDGVNQNSGIKVLSIKFKGSYMAVVLNFNISEKKNVFVVYFQYTDFHHTYLMFSHSF